MKLDLISKIENDKLVQSRSKYKYLLQYYLVHWRLYHAIFRSHSKIIKSKKSVHQIYHKRENFEQATSWFQKVIGIHSFELYIRT
jgi:hypothetical protein